MSPAAGLFYIQWINLVYGFCRSARSLERAYFYLKKYTFLEKPKGPETDKK